MGTNFYFFTSDKKVKEEYFGSRARLVDTPDFGYMLHLAKTSGGWLPLFEAHDNIKSVKDIKSIYDAAFGKIEILDEYGNKYSWEEFVERVLEHNGGTVARRKKKPVECDMTSKYCDPGMPPWVPVSHFEYKPVHFWDGADNGYFKDDEGYEFDYREFT